MDRASCSCRAVGSCMLTAGCACMHLESRVAMHCFLICFAQLPCTYQDGMDVTCNVTESERTLSLSHTHVTRV